MRILLVTETYLPFISGVATSTDSIARFMLGQGHRVTICCPHPVIDKPAPKYPGLTLGYAPSVPDLFYRGKPLTIFPLGIFSLIKLFKHNKFDVVHIQEPGSVGLTALIMAKIYKVPTVGALHFTPEQIARMIPGKPEKLVKPIIEAFIKYIYNLYDAIMVPTQTFSDFLGRVGVIKPITVVSNGVDTGYFQPKTHPAGKIVTFFFLGRLDLDKNVTTLVKAMPYTNSKVKLLVVGSGKIEQKLHQLASDLKVNDKITWVKHITEKEMPGYYRKADCFAIMSPYEVQSIVTLQAIASGLPIIAANMGALPELCRPNKNGYLVSVYDYKTLARKMNFLADNPKLRKEFGKKSREMSLIHDKARVLKKLEMIYRQQSR
jgi:glycosyltransferase involved in cell wall biosynthesis